jgi:hypothetical protein
LDRHKAVTPEEASMTEGADNSKPPNTTSPIAAGLGLAELHHVEASIRKRPDAIGERNNEALPG